MHVFELTRKQALQDEDFPLSSVQAKVTLLLESKVDLPVAAARRMALRELRRLLQEAEEEELLTVANSAADLYSSSHEEQAEGENASHAPGASRGWVQPAGLDLRIAKSAHRMVLEVAKRGESGRVVFASELVGAMGLSAPTIGRLLRTGDPGNAYLAQYVRITPDGRTKSLDLTPEGRVLASRIRAGVVPL